MQKFVALIAFLLGALLILKFLKTFWLVLLLAGAALAWGASSKWIGKWGYPAAFVCVLVAIPGFMLRMAGAMMRFLPLVLLAVVAFMLFKSFKK